MKINFIQGTSDQHKVIANIINKLSSLLPLPDRIDVLLQSLGPSSYGETIVTSSFIKRIILNQDLTANELFFPTIHELVHVSQIHQGKLSASRTGVFVWEHKTYHVDPRKMSYSEYQKLPWELEAHEQQYILGNILLKNS